MPLVEVEGGPALLFTRRARGISQGGQVSHCRSCWSTVACRSVFPAAGQTQRTAGTWCVDCVVSRTVAGLSGEDRAEGDGGGAGDTRSQSSGMLLGC